MFCTNCGREIIDTARFCSFCGTPIRNMAASIPVQPVQQVQPAQPVQPQAVPQPVPEANYTETADIPITDTAGVPAAESENADVTSVESVSEMPEMPEAAVEAPGEVSAVISAPVTENVPPLPTPNNIPTYGASEPAYPAPPVYPDQNIIPVQSVPEKRPERKYTLGHIMMCLAAVAVMAIVAGVFAGLYFSVV